MSSKTTVITILLFLCCSCATGINKQQRKAYEVYKEKNLLVEEKNPNIAFKLGFLPGGSSFYNNDYDLAVINLLSWPLSITWEVGNAKNRSMLINYNATEIRVKKDFKKELKRLDDQMEIEETLSKAQYDKELRQILEKYYNQYSFILDKYKSFVVGGGDNIYETQSSYSSLPGIERRISEICEEEFRVIKQEVKK